MITRSQYSQRSVRVARCKRRGFTLRELSIAMSVGSIVMMTAVGMLHHAFDWSTTAMKRRQDDQTCFRLAQQLRTDLVDAEAATVSDKDDQGGQTLQIQMHDSVVVSYRISDQNVTRVSSRNQQTLSQERFRWRIDRSVVFTSGSGDQIGVEIRTNSFEPPSEIPLWRRMRVTIGLRRKHIRGELAS